MIFISENIRLLRKKAGLTQGQLAEKLNVNANTVSNYEKGNSSPDFGTLELIVKILDVSAHDLLYKNLSNEKYMKCEQVNCTHECSQNYSNTKSTENVSKLPGNIFNTKSTENATIINSGVNGGKVGDKRKVQKTPPNDGTITYPPTKPTSSIATNNTGVYTTSEVKPNYMSNLTDEEIDNVIRTQFREHLFEMVESGRYYPAAMVTAMMENQAAQLTELQKKLSEMETKLNSCTPSKNNDHLNPQHKHK